MNPHPLTPAPTGRGRAEPARRAGSARLERAPSAPARGAPSGGGAGSLRAVRVNGAGVKSFLIYCFLLQNNHNKTTMKTREYRQNVGIVIIKNQLIFAGFRKDLPLTSKTGWQMPQGGIDEVESVLQAGYRELYEETGIKKDKVKLIKILPETIKYDFPQEVLQKWNRFAQYKGQEQHWIVFEFIGEETDINLNVFPEEIEFQKYDWKTADFLIENVYEMKKEVYKKVFAILKQDNLID